MKAFAGWLSPAIPQINSSGAGEGCSKEWKILPPELLSVRGPDTFRSRTNRLNGGGDFKQVVMSKTEP